MILRDTETAIQNLLQKQLDDLTGWPASIPVLVGDEEENKPQMPYVIVQCPEAEEEISPGCGIFNVTGEIRFRSHTKGMSPNDRQEVFGAINDFAYNATAANLSLATGFHCYGWQPLGGTLTIENETKSTLYSFKFSAHCMSRDNT